MATNKRKRGFKTEVQQLLDLMIHSLYSEREIFVRELVSNAADALDRARFLALTEGELTPTGDGEPGIRITLDPEARTFTIEDDGVGMTEDEVVKNLGTIAHSGSKAFLDVLKEKGPTDAPSFIGQFGVGFYASFMVADEVVVDTLSAQPGSEPIRWRSKGHDHYTLEPSERAVRGTRIVLTLREDAAEFAGAARIPTIVRRFSNYLPWPITVDGDQANDAKALWLEPPSQVEETETNDFYKSLAMDWQDPALTLHVAVDSPIQYKALLFVPSQRPHDLFHPEADRGPRLYHSRVMIMDHAKELLPDWLRFVRGVVSSEDVALNVSREMVQKTPVVRKIRDALAKRMIKELLALETEKYEGIWRDFGMILKEGFYHSTESWRERMLPLLRFNAVSHDDEQGLLSLAQYKEAMPEGQDAIWYLTASSRAAALASPHLEAFHKRGWDVLILTDSVDEWLTAVLTEFDGVPLRSISRGELELDDDDDVAGEGADLTGLVPWLEEVYADEVAGVRTSNRLTDSACVLVDDEQGISANLERILRDVKGDAPAARRFLELNPRHPLVRNLALLQETGRTSDAEPLARLLLDDALLLEGTVRDSTAMGRRLQELLLRASQAAVEAAV